MPHQRIALLVAGLALSGGLAAAPAAAAPAQPKAAASCSAWKWIEITGAKAKYQECFQTVSGKKQVKGNLQLWDLKTDGKSVQAYARTDTNHWYGDKVSWEKFYGWGNTAKASPVYSSGWHGGDDFELTIQLV
ncbi:MULTISPECIES: hypothetical protein [unclassified Streptomyces]|uniref:hypothetical protein n=1 Tax=unclassified Streptomyces TaxID=2593676 RepID=UPI002E150AC3|nr:hypothetical protein OG279_38470 [Streptomyces sp. NBC_01201]